MDEPRTVPQPHGSGDAGDGGERLPRPQRPARSRMGTGEGRGAGAGHGSREAVDDEAQSLSPGGADDVGKRIRTFLGEFRMVIPAMAALFGFQLTVAFQDSFADLPLVDRAINFAGLVCTGVAFLFLLVPASYHRFLAHQEDTEEFLLFARRSIHLAFMFIPGALALSLYMQALRSFESRAAAAAVAVGSLAMFVMAWWIYPKQRARASGHEAGKDEETAHQPRSPQR